VRAPTFFQAYGQWMQSALPTREDVQWLREQWDGPFMVRGITRVDDARRAAEIGATAISVSNHGGNHLDGTPGTRPGAPGYRRGCRRPARGRAGWRRAPGRRRGEGPRARRPRGHDRTGLPVGPGRERAGGVENVLDILRGGVDATVLGLGHRSVHDLTRDDVIVPPGVERRPGAQTPRG
jgi:hypothetical protein